ncbi:MAG: MFS transporter [Yersiniaceae bacterium]|nr:MFS transporter [Yersiniaceae bacterium]
MSVVSVPPVSAGSAPPAAPAAQPFTGRLVVGLVGVLIAALSSGLNDRVTDIALSDVRGALSIGSDEGSWLIGGYQAAEVAAMMLAPWLAMTFSMRRFAMAMVLGFGLLGAVIPFAPNLPLFIALRVIQGLFGGALPPLLMTVALRFLPPGFKLYGLGAYALSATFGPNMATSLAALWTDHVGWQFVYWQVIPPCLLAFAMISHGIPQDPLRLERFRQIDAFGMVTGCSGVAMLVLALQQGERQDWLASTQICALLFGAGVLLTVFLINEWYHPLPLFKLQMLKRRNLAHGLLTLAGLMVVYLSGSALPSNYLMSVNGFRASEMGPLSLTIGVPQLLMAPLVAAVCNLRWVDSRWVLATGLAILAFACYCGSEINSAWVQDNFYWLQAMQAVAQPMAVIPILLSATSVVQPPEGPFASAMFNTVRGLGSVAGSALLETVISHREKFHSHVLLDHAGSVSYLLSQPYDGNRAPPAPLNPDGSAVSSEVLARFATLVKHQATILGLSDTYLMIMGVALGLIILAALLPQRTYPPQSLVNR